jgi:hypothetical protein
MDDREKRQFEDDLLDAALAERATAEPRTGLEPRLLAAIAARRRAPGLPRWVWVFAGGAAVLVALAIIVFRRPAASVPSAPPAVTVGRVGPFVPVAARPPMRRIPPPAASARTVRPAAFPTPRPLSPEEKLLLAYVRKSRLGEAEHGSFQSPDEDLKIPKLDVAALDIKPIEDSEKSPEK